MYTVGSDGMGIGLKKAGFFMKKRFNF